MPTTGDYPDYTSGLTYILSGGLLTATDYPDWTDGVYDITGNIVAGQDFPDWVKAVGQITIPLTSPKGLTGLTSWYDASQITGQSDNTTLTTWPDLSGNNYTLTVSTGGPTYYKTTAGKLINGLPAVWFAQTPSFQMMTNSGPTLVSASGWTSFAVVIFTSNTGTQDTYSQDSGSTPQRIARLGQSASGVVTVTTWDSNGTTAVNATAGTVTANTACSIMGTNDGSHLTAYFNGTAGTPVTTSGQNTTGHPASFIGGANAGNGNFTGALAELGTYNQSQTAADLARLHTYLSTKWGTP